MRLAMLLLVIPAMAHASARGRIVAAAERHLGERYRGDCSGFVEHVLDQAGAHVTPAIAPNGTEALYRALPHRARPRPGDVAFFHDTFDRNRDGRVDDPFTHVALVERVRGSHVTLIHRGSRGIARLHLDLTHPRDPDRNSVLRVPRRDDSPRTPHLAGELLIGFGSPVHGPRLARR